MKKIDGEKPHIIQLSHFLDHRGNLSVVESMKSIPFDIKRVFWINDVPAGRGRGGHAHRWQSMLIVAASGSFSVILDDGESSETFVLDSPSEGLLVTPGIWNILENFSENAVCMVFASDFYDEEEYIREYDDFREFIARKR